MINWAEEFSRVPYYERVHLAKGVALSFFVASIIAALVYVSSNRALSGSYRIAHKIVSYISLASLLFILGRKGIKDPLSRQEACALAHYLQVNEQFTLSEEEGGGQFGTGANVNIPLLRFRRNLAYITLLTFLLATLAITGGILSFKNKAGFSHLSSNLIGLGTTLSLWTCGLGMANFTLAKLREPLTFIPSLAPLIDQPQDDAPNVVLLFEAQSLIYMLNKLRFMSVQIINRANEIDTSPQIEEISEANRLECYNQALITLRSAEFSSTFLSQEHLERLYQSLFSFCHRDLFREQSRELIYLVQKHPNFNFMHFLRYSYETIKSEELSALVDLPELLNSLFVLSLNNGTLLELSCVLAVAERTCDVVPIEQVNLCIDREKQALQIISSAISTFLPTQLNNLCLEYCPQPDFYLLTADDRVWMYTNLLEYTSMNLTM